MSQKSGTWQVSELRFALGFLGGTYFQKYACSPPEVLIHTGEKVWIYFEELELEEQGLYYNFA